MAASTQSKRNLLSESIFKRLPRLKIPSEILQVPRNKRRFCGPLLNIWLADKKLKEINNTARLKRKGKRTGSTAKPGEIKWIEKLLQTPIDDYRKNAVALILAPYLVNIKKLSYDDAFSIITEWLINAIRLEN